MNTAGGATDVRRLAGVLLHVRAFDADPEGCAVVEGYVEVAVDGDRLVVLGDLVVLGHVR